MYSIIENVVVTVIVIAILGKTIYSVYKMLKPARTDSPHACTGSCGSCRMCSNNRQVKIS